MNKKKFSEKIVSFGFLCVLATLLQITSVRFFREAIGAIVVHPFSMVSFFTCTTPNRSRVGAIVKPDQSEQVFDA